MQAVKTTQARGRERRAALVQSARALLADRSLDALSLVSVAEHAGIPASSAYHLFPDMTALLKELARELATEMIANIGELPRSDDWQRLTALYLKRAQQLFNADRALREILLGPKTPPEIRHAEDNLFGQALLAMIRRDLKLPDDKGLERVFLKAILIADLMFSLSIADHDQVTNDALQDALVASIAYLSMHLEEEDAAA